MNKQRIKCRLVGAVILSAVGVTHSAFAHDIVSTLTNGALTKGSGVTDVWSVQCELDDTAASQNPTDHLLISVSDNNAAGGPVSATAVWNDTIVSGVPHNTATAVTVTDLTSTGGASPSKTLRLPTARQNANFTILVHHTSAATDSYTVTVHCEDAQNVHTGTTEPTSLQNQ